MIGPYVMSTGFPPSTNILVTLNNFDWEDSDAGMLVVFGYADRTLDLSPAFTVSPDFPDLAEYDVTPESGDRPAGHIRAWTFTVGVDFMPDDEITVTVDSAFVPSSSSGWAFMVVRWRPEADSAPVPASYQLYGSGGWSGPGHNPFAQLNNAVQVETHVANASAFIAVVGWDPTNLMAPEAVELHDANTWGEIGAGAYNGITYACLKRDIPTPTDPWLTERPIWSVKDSFYPWFDFAYTFAEIEPDPPDPSSFVGQALLT